MAGAQSDGSDTCCTGLTNLPEDILYNIFAHLDEASLCEAAQICPAFLRLAGNPDFWMHMPAGVMPEDRLKLASSSCLSRALRLPPQIFTQESWSHVRVNGEPMVSQRGPYIRLPESLLAIELHNVGYISAYNLSSDAFATACSGIAGQIKRAQLAKDVPAAVFERVERDRFHVKFYLNQGPAMSAILHGLEELGWPAAVELSTSRLHCPTPRSSARARLLWHWGRMRPNHEQTSKPAEMLLEHSAPSYRSLCEGAQQCLEAAHLQGKHPSLLQGWLGPAGALAQHASKHDMDLVIDLQRSLFNKLEALTAWKEGTKGSSYALAKVADTAAEALQRHLSTWVMRWLPFLAKDSPNGLVELAECIRQKLSHVTSADGHPPEEVREGGGQLVQDGREADAVAQSEREHANQIAGILQGVDVRLRLKARLHLEVLRIMHWCFFVLGRDLMQYPD